MSLIILLALAYGPLSWDFPEWVWALAIVDYTIGPPVAWLRRRWAFRGWPPKPPRHRSRTPGAS